MESHRSWLKLHINVLLKYRFQAEGLTNRSAVCEGNYHLTQTGERASFLEAKFLFYVPENTLVFDFTDTSPFQAVWNSSIGHEFAYRREKLTGKTEGCVH